MPRIIDISLTLSPRLPTFPNNAGFALHPVKRIARGESSNVSRLSIGTHSGTHVDPPSHFIDGAPGVDELDLDDLVGEAYVADLTSASSIGPAELESATLPVDARRVLFRTTNSMLWQTANDFQDAYVAVTAEGARWIVDRGIRLVGIDFLSVEARGAPGRPAHHALLEAGVVIVEGLDLTGVDAGLYTLVCLPLKIAGADGAPARAILIRD